MWHAGLLNKLSKLLPPQLYRIMASYLMERTFHVIGNDGIISRTCSINAGVPQGSVLGPILYTIYTSDMPLPLRLTWTQHQQHDHSTNNSTNNDQQFLLSTFADDTVIMATSSIPSTAIRVNKLYLDNIVEWARKWCIGINEAKTAHILFTKRRLRNLHLPPMPIINNRAITNKTRHQYLGLHLDHKLTMRFHISQLRARITALAKKFDWIIGRNSKLSKKCKLLLYKQCVQPIWRYAIPVWGALASETQFNRIVTRNNLTIRKIVKATRFTRNQVIRERHNLQSANEIFESASHNYACTLATHVNVEARNLIYTPFTPSRLHWPRYSKQLQSHIIPTQQLYGEQIQQHQLNRNASHIPTLLRQQHEENQMQQQVEQQRRQEQLIERRRQEPIQRFPEYYINSLRRRLENGEITREAAERIIEGQHWQIQQLIIPDLHQDRERSLPQGWLTRQQLRQQRRRRYREQHPLPAAALVNIPDAEVVPISDDDEPEYMGTIMAPSQNDERHN